MIYFNIFVAVMCVILMVSEFDRKGWNMIYTYEIYLAVSIFGFALYDIIKYFQS